jgi:hypothetical protein
MSYGSLPEEGQGSMEAFQRRAKDLWKPSRGGPRIYGSLPEEGQGAMEAFQRRAKELWKPSRGGPRSSGSLEVFPNSAVRSIDLLLDAFAIKDSK